MLGGKEGEAKGNELREKRGGHNRRKGKGGGGEKQREAAFEGARKGRKGRKGRKVEHQ